jgi:hypothetical protein
MIDTDFAHITDKDGNQFQVLSYELDPVTGEEVVVDWDEEATADSIQPQKQTSRKKMSGK